MYRPSEEARRIFDLLRQNSERLGLPVDMLTSQVQFHSDSETIYYPIPFKVTETLAALKGIEGALAALIADLQSGTKPHERKTTINLERATLFGFQALATKINGYSGSDPEVKRYLKDTDIHAAQSNPYRRMAASMYRTKDDNEFFHLHGSLNPTPTLNMIGLDSHCAYLTNYDDIINTIQSQVQKFSAAELETLNETYRQAGVTVYEHEEFKNTPHGRTNIQEPWWKVMRLPGEAPPAVFNPSGGPRILEGVKVLELCCVIAGPIIGRTLAEYGADVLKITSPTVPDVPFFQVDNNMGKRAVELDLKTDEGRRQFEALLAEADVVIDGYRPGALRKLGYSPESMAAMAEKRGKGIVYVDETCFGHEGEWCHRPGWQQIADCLTGFARCHGRFLRRVEPMVSPLPIADSGAGCMGAIAALTGLYNRAQYGGSYIGQVSLMQFNLLLYATGKYPEPVESQLQKSFAPAFSKIRFCDSVGRSSVLALEVMREQFPYLFAEPSPENRQEKLTEVWYSHHYGADVEVVRPVAEIEGVVNGFARATRPNGADASPSWDFPEEQGSRKL
ncbi:CAIB/BAIF family enzyme [Aspergillus vadensis CBS 113365]|uniref:CAIB/BAIF family enzyme n=1 Tax=Aspergillus vadensis (strain CBS 113365 / IMI 142717 / IBT 24658) TaxID=1448311 RepID=A0A319BEF0_ASPVC|nr:CAIB/BAIF family enzyme [Aspergillus vadensis CBS 113365]PYH70394.1 CAIB/BAIF family enzyme [Aspergillus vadensis CBS 113365]